MDDFSQSIIDKLETLLRDAKAGKVEFTALGFDGLRMDHTIQNNETYEISVRVKVGEKMGRKPFAESMAYWHA